MPTTTGHTNPALIELNGAVVEQFDVSGSVSGSKAAIFVACNAHVKEIDFLKGATINGKIISEYQAVDGAGRTRERGG